MGDIVCLPEATRRRMVQLLEILKAWPEKKITSAQISGITGWKSSLIRHDFWLLGTNLNGVSNGYFTEDLKEALKEGIWQGSCRKTENVEILKQVQDDDLVGQDDDLVGQNSKNCCIVGLGRLGAALLDQNFFADSGFEVKVGFDANLYRIEILRSTFPLYPADQMARVIKQEKIEYAILTVQSKDAQSMADHLVVAGIKGIVNLSRAVIKVPKRVRVENISIINALNLVGQR